MEIQYAVVNEPVCQAGEFVLQEARNYGSRDAVTVLSGQNLQAGHVVGKVTASTTVAAPTFTGTGNGVITMDATTPTLHRVKVGTYLATCTHADTNAGVFSVLDPDGYSLGDVKVGNTFANQIKFAIADGSSDFAVGDQFSIVVAAGSGKIVEYNPSNTDGSDVPYGILYDRQNATAGDKPGVALVRACQIKSTLLTWFSGATDSQKAAAIAKFASSEVVVR